MATSDPTTKPQEPLNDVPPPPKATRRLALTAFLTAGVLGLIGIASFFPLADREDMATQANIVLTLAALAVMIATKVCLLTTWPLWLREMYETKMIALFFVISNLITLALAAYVASKRTLTDPFGFDGPDVAVATMRGLHVDLTFLAVFWLQVGGDEDQRLLAIFRICLIAPLVLLFTQQIELLQEILAAFYLGFGTLWRAWTVLYLVGLVWVGRLLWRRPHDLPLTM